MKTFRYRAKKSPTEIKEGTIQAQNSDEVIAKVNDMGLVVIHIQEEDGSLPGASSKPSSQQSTYRGRLGPHVTRFYKQLSRILQSGIPILQALSIMADQTEKARLKHVIQEIHKVVAEGHPLSQAMAAHPEYFSPFDLALVEAGEMAGKLDESLKRIGSYRENQEKLSSKIRGSLAYPAFIIAAGFAAMIFMLAYVMPKFSDFFLSLDQELPWLTRMLILSSQIMQKIWPGILAAVVAGGWLIKRSLAGDGNQMMVHRFYLRLPKAGGLVLQAQFSRFARTLSLLLESGIPLLRALQASLVVLTNQVLRREMEICHAAVAGGESFGEALRRAEYVPLLVTQLVQAGEHAGRLQESLNDIADGYEQELQENAEILTKLLEPVLILFVGAMLGVMIIAVLLPVFSMNAAIS